MTRRKLTSFYTREEFSWMMQDWANSAYSLMITTAIFPLFYKTVAESAGMADSQSTAYLGYANSIATFVVAALAPFLGTMADYPGYRRPMFTFGTLLGVFSVLAMIPAGGQSWLLLLVLYFLSDIGFGVSNIFYDSSLMDVTTRDRLDLVSSAGFGLGYIGSVFPFLIFMGLQMSGALTGNHLVNFGFLLTAAWWFIFTIPYWKHVKQKSFESKSVDKVFVATWQSLVKTFKDLKNYRHIWLFLIGYFFYIDGVGTIIKMATSVGSDMGLTDTQLIVMLLVVQLVAFPCSFLYGILAKRIGTRKMLFVGIFTYTVICGMALSLATFNDFLLLAVLVGTAQGGIQSLSRAYFASIIPDSKSNQFFGFYNIFGKFSSFLGTTTLAFVAHLTGDSLKGLFAIMGQFILGAILLWLSKVPKQSEVETI